MKTIVVSLFLSTLLFSCGSEESKIGRPNTYTGTGSGSGGGTGDTGAAPTTTDVPIDGGLSVLLIAGAAYGAKRIRANKQKQNAASAS